ncbi:hypothetical protein RIF29_43362 [Crotalaria pallida]|uniref:Uncharacterized protein n=1 Tax=Crotalaria pallida TaxID=3830 RepID=A0AAN9DZW7_CROPI
MKTTGKKGVDQGSWFGFGRLPWAGSELGVTFGTKADGVGSKGFDHLAHRRDAGNMAFLPGRSLSRSSQRCRETRKSTGRLRRIFRVTEDLVLLLATDPTAELSTANNCYYCTGSL